MDNFSYHMPTKIIFNCGEIQNINSYTHKKKILLVTTNGMLKRNPYTIIKDNIKNVVDVISDVPSHPSFSSLENLYNKAWANDFDLIVALGGGSVLDTSKFIATHNDNHDYNFVKDITKGNIPKENYKTIPIIAIPTTAGTGSEITPWATIWDTEEKKKYSLNLPELFAKIAIYDPEVTLTLPKNITVQTTLDALSHSLESIWNKNASEITRSNAVKACKLILKNLPLLVNDLDNINLRSNILKACMYSGLAFSNTQTAIAHAISYYITLHKGIDHGIACSFTLPMILEKAIGISDNIDNAIIEIFGDLSSKKIKSFFQDLNVSIDFKDYNIDSNDIEDIKKSLSSNPRAGNSLVNNVL